MSSSATHNQYPIPAPESAHLAEHLVKRKLTAEVRLAKLQTGFLQNPNFNKKESLLPIVFVDGLKSYLAHPAVELPADWPPRSWSTKHGLRDVVETFRLPKDDTVDTMLQKDTIFTAIENDLIAASKHMPTTDVDITTWRNLVKVCHRLRSDEVEAQPERLEETSQLQDVLWQTVIVKLADCRPDGV
ncbi:MAG: hypothetical protein ABIV43_00645 [Candidatus Saccharimonadales bacterium]